MENGLIIFAVVFAVASIVCAFMESKTTGFYSAIGAYGRAKAYFALDFTGAGIVLIVSPLIPKLEMGLPPVAGVVVGLVLLALGVLMYVTSYRKCLPFARKKCIISMIVSGMGVAFKICIFMFFGIWKLYGPKTIITESGEKLILYDKDVYSFSGERVGKQTDINQIVRKKKV